MSADGICAAITTYENKALTPDVLREEMLLEDKGGAMLLAAVQARNLEAIEKIAAAGVDLDGHFLHDRQTASQVAAENGESMVLKKLLDLGADPNCQDRNGLPLIFYARGSMECLRVAVDAGAEVNGRGWSSILYNATLHGSTESVQFLLERGADPNRDAKSSVRGSKTPLRAAVSNLHEDAEAKDACLKAKLLIAAGAVPIPDEAQWIADAMAAAAAGKDMDFIKAMAHAHPDTACQREGYAAAFDQEIRARIEVCDERFFNAYTLIAPRLEDLIIARRMKAAAQVADTPMRTRKHTGISSL